MEAILGVWLTSVVGATAFSAAGYVLGQRGVLLPFLGLTEGATDRAVSTPSTADTSRAAVSDANGATGEDAQGGAPATRKPTTRSDSGRAETTTAKGCESDDDDARPTLVPGRMEHAAVVATTVSSIPPLRTPSILHPDGAVNAPGAPGAAELESVKADLHAAQVQAAAVAQRTRAMEVVKSELERQLELVRSELRREVVARATADLRVEELGDRLASASEEASSLRHKVALLDRQSRQLREALQGRVRALTTSERHRRRDLEEAEEIRVKLQNVYAKIGTSLPPGPTSDAGASRADAALSSDDRPADAREEAPAHAREEAAAVVRDGGPRRLEDAKLLEENRRLAEENNALRQRVLGSSPPKPTTERESVPEVELDLYRDLIERLGSVAGLRGAVVADEMGSRLFGSGEFADALAAFGAYIRDASGRTDRLLPLEGVAEVDIRDHGGQHLSTRVVSHASSELCIVLLSTADASLAAAKKIIDDTLRRQP